MEKKMSRRSIPWHQFAAVGTVLMLGACAQTATPMVASNPPPVAPGPHASWYSVSFDSNSSVVSPDGAKTVGDVAAYLQRNPTAVATIIGRTDTVGGSDYNMRLSHRRADAVRDTLVYNDHVAADRVETRWTGETRPRVASADDAAVAANRVVDIAVH
jgi:OOP family OmpA-OmpF porin